MTPSSPSLTSGLVALAATTALLLGATPALAESATPGGIGAAAVADGSVATLSGGDELAPGESIVSAGGGVRFVMQTDGNAVTYGSDGRATWSTGTQGRGDHLAMQTDGNVVIYDAGDRPVWFTGTSGQPGATLTVQDDANLVVYRADGSPAWASSVGAIAAPITDYLGGGDELTAGSEMTSENGRYRLAMQTDGNLVVYGPGGAEWSAGTSGAGNRLAMQTDGNAVVYGANGAVKWTSRTAGNPGAVLVMQGDGNLVIYGLTGGALWASRAAAPVVTTDTLNAPGRLASGQSLVSANGAWRATMQGDGNFVVVGPNGPDWSTQTRSTPGLQPAGSGGSTFSLEAQGGLSVSGWGPDAHWFAFPRYFVNEGPAVAPFRLVMQNDGNLVEYDGRNRPVWASRGL